ncbi:MAG: restriction endonuclease subunit S [Spirochaetes bacterium]|nr:restriction endonuclease subunit S [Spirochaetota bacterium]
MKTGWQIKTLAEVCQIKPPKAEARCRLSATDMVSFVPMEDLGIDQKILVPIQTKPLGDVDGSYTYFADGDVLLAKITPCFENGKLGIAANLTNGIGFGSSEYIVFRPNKFVNKEWIYYVLSRESFREEGTARMNGAVGHKRVAKEFIESYPVPIPPLPEQRRIVGILDKAFDGIATAKSNTEKNLQNARELFESYLQSVFTQQGQGWEEKRLGEVYDVRDGTHDSPKYHTTGFPLITSKNLKKEGLSFENVNLINEQDFIKINQRSVVHKGDVLFAMIGTIGNPTIVTVKPNFAIKNVALFKIPHNQSGPFLKHYLASSWVVSKMMKEAKGTTQKFVGLGYLRDFPINIPPLPKQLEVVKKLEEMSAETQCLKSIYQRKLTALDELKKSLLHQAFSGEL